MFGLLITKPYVSEAIAFHLPQLHLSQRLADTGAYPRCRDISSRPLLEKLKL